MGDEAGGERGINNGAYGVRLAVGGGVSVLSAFLLYKN